MNERLKEIRKKLELTQQKFAERLNTSRNNIAGYEAGTRAPSSAMVALICKEFNINEAWLRDGSGEMFRPAGADPLDALVSQYNLSAADSILIEKFVNMEASKRAAIVEYVVGTAAALAGDPVATSQQGRPAAWDFDSLSIEEKVDLYREELEKEAEANEGLKGDAASSAAS